MKLNFTYKKWHSLMLLLMFFGFSNYASATTYFAKNAGNWELNTTWATGSNVGPSPAVGIWPVAGDDVIINKAITITIPANTNPACATLTISANGNLSFVTATPNSNSLTCSGIIACGTTTKGTIVMVNGSTLITQKLTLGAASSTILGRNGLTNSAFIFTGSGSGVVPVLAGDTAITADFNGVTFNPGAGNTVTVPLGFSSKSLSITTGTVDFATNYNSTFTSGTDLSMNADTVLLFGGTEQLPYLSYILNNTSTINYTGAIQKIRGLAYPAAYKNLTLSGPGVKTLMGDVNIDLTVLVQNGVTLNIGSNSLTLNGTYQNTGTGCTRGSKNSNLWYRGYADSTFNFDQVTLDGNALNNVTVGLSEIEFGYVPSIGNNLDLVIGDKLNIYGLLTLTTGHLKTNGNVTLKSNDLTTAIIAPIVDNTIAGTDPGLSYNGITGNVIVERYVSVARAYRPLSPSVTGGSIFDNWQEGGLTTSLTGSISGNVLTSANNLDLLGKHISGVGVPAHTVITDVTNAATGSYGITTIQSDVSRSFTSRISIINPTVAATFTASVTDNVLDVTAIVSGTLAAGQKIVGTSVLAANTIITGQLTGLIGGIGTYTIDIAPGTLSVASETMYYNGETPGFGTHITGVACTDAQLGQVNAVSGLDNTRSGQASMFEYHNSTNLFSPVLNTKAEMLLAGKPYMIAIRGDRTADIALNSTPPSTTVIRSTGTIVAGTQNVDSQLNSTIGSFNFIGNPYQAPVDLSQMYLNGLVTGLGSSYTVFDTTLNVRGAYVTYDFDLATNDNPTSLADGTIEPNQGFFITTAAAAPSLQFEETYKVADNTYKAMFRKAQNTTSIIRGTVLSSNTNKGLDGFILAFSDDFSTEILAEDTTKPTGNEDETFASKNGVQSMAIDKRKIPADNDVIALNLTQERLTDYILNFEVSNFDAKDAYLVDAYTAKETPLTNGQINSYAFKVDSTPASAAANRFSILFKAAALSTKSNSISQFAVYPNPVIDNKFTVKTNQDFSGKVVNLNIINTLGQKVYSTTGTFSNDGSIAVNPTNAISKGIYLLKVSANGKVETKNLIIK